MAMLGVRGAWAQARRGLRNPSCWPLYTPLTHRHASTVVANDTVARVAAAMLKEREVLLEKV